MASSWLTACWPGVTWNSSDMLKVAGQSYIDNIHLLPHLFSSSGRSAENWSYESELAMPAMMTEMTAPSRPGIPCKLFTGLDNILLE